MERERERPSEFRTSITEIYKEVFNLDLPSQEEGSYPQNCMVELPRIQVSELHFDTSQCWKKNFKTEVCSCSCCLTDAMLWIKEVEVAKSVDDLLTSQSIEGHVFHYFEMLDSKMATALKRIITNQHFRRIINLKEQQAQKYERFLRGRQMAYMIHQQFRQFSPRKWSWTTSTIILSSSEIADTKMTEEDFQKGTHSGEVVHPERNVKHRARFTSKKIVRIRRVIIGIFPYVKSTREKVGMQIRRRVSLQAP